MGIRKIIAIVSFGFIAINVQAGSTNSWRATGSSGFWDASGSAWSLSAPPAITDTADFITNVVSKQITIDSVVVSDSPDTLTISNLTVGGVGSATNTLLLNEGGISVPLEILSSMTVSNAGILQITNSFLKVDGNTGGLFTLLGSMRVLNAAKVQLNKATILPGAVLQFALGTGSIPVAVTSDLTLAGTLNITNGGGFTNTTYTLFTYGGALAGSLTLGATPTNTTCVINTNTIGEVNLVVTLPSSSSTSTASVQLITIVRNTANIALTWAAPGGSTSLVQFTSGDVNGSYNTNNFTDIPASQLIAPGSGIVTNTYTDVGGATNTPSRFYRVHYFQ